jgi:hypothetical protein
MTSTKGSAQAVLSASVRSSRGIRNTPDGKRFILGCSVELSEAEHHGRKFLQSLVDRGMRGTKLVVSEDHAGAKLARQAAMRVDVARDIKRICNADDAAETDLRLKDTVSRYPKSAPCLANSPEANVPEASPASEKRDFQKRYALSQEPALSGLRHWADL